jgi:hypothetical protein
VPFFDHLWFAREGRPGLRGCASESYQLRERRNDSTLGSSGIRSEELRLRKHTGLEECQDKPIHLRITDASANSDHQTMVVDVIEASFNVPFDGPLIWEPIGFRRGFFRA